MRLLAVALLLGSAVAFDATTPSQEGCRDLVGNLCKDLKKLKLCGMQVVRDSCRKTCGVCDSASTLIPENSTVVYEVTTPDWGNDNSTATDDYDYPWSTNNTSVNGTTDWPLDQNSTAGYDSTTDYDWGNDNSTDLPNVNGTDYGQSTPGYSDSITWWPSWTTRNWWGWGTSEPPTRGYDETTPRYHEDTTQRPWWLTTKWNWPWGTSEYTDGYDGTPTTSYPDGTTWWPRWTTRGWWGTTDWNWWGTTPDYGHHWETTTPYSWETTETQCIDTPGTNCRRFQEAGLCILVPIRDECKRSCGAC
ncbi:hypothetical protein QR680_014005 [Steinernema hermaphroditum]|uniref:ShKT domain-containing protein n=1 Tax=Steinernema hermaphroditum TaxID=289476 RepID=A0AA39M3B4_9BILA|nr:hypothetical protein QR680_014005 [Steinernema hermaphroditum]